ncbi:MAG: transglutaminase-like domain-containing protein [Bacteroidota bacterium]
MNQNELKALISLLDDEDTSVFKHVHNKIASFGPSVIPFLESELTERKHPLIIERVQDLIQIMNYDNILNRLKIWSKSENQDLLKALWIIASYQYPGLSYESIHKEVEQIYYEAWLEFRYDMHPFDQIKVLNGIFFKKLNFKANTQDFHSPENSMINDVLRNRKGNPISLCVIYMLVANKLKLPVFGVNLPNLFILTYKNAQFQFYINAFNKGLIFSKADIDNYISQLKIDTKKTYYEPCNNLDIVKRMLRNLAVAYNKNGNEERIEDINHIISILEKE